jgi:RNA polymerase sigma-70 factor, ECF subfamily
MVTSLSGYQPTAVPFRAWLYRIARNLIIDHYRTQDGRVDTSLDAVENISSGSDQPGPIVERRLTLELIQAALFTIDPAQQEVIRLRFISGLSLAEVALTVDKTVSAVKSLQHRGLAALRTALVQV